MTDGIATEDEYRATLRELQSVLAEEGDRPESDRFHSLASIAEAYEDQYYGIDEFDSGR